jgi:hypothetical protein
MPSIQENLLSSQRAYGPAFAGSIEGQQIEALLNSRCAASYLREKETQRHRLYSGECFVAEIHLIA